MPNYQYLYPSNSPLKENCSTPFGCENDEDVIEKGEEFLESIESVDEILVVEVGTEDGEPQVLRLVANLHKGGIHVNVYGDEDYD